MNLSPTTWTAALGGLTSLLAMLSTLSVTFVELNDYLSETWRVRIAITSAVASCLLKWLNGYLTPDVSKVNPKP